jgi:hypothetical protein
MRYSLRGLLVLMTVTGIALGVWANRVNQRKRAVAELQSYTPASTSARNVMATACFLSAGLPMHLGIH